MARYRLIVTQEDIDEGIPENYSRHPLALALSRMLDKKVHVTMNWFYFFDKSLDNPPAEVVFIYLPVVISYWVHRSNSSGAVLPFEYEVEISEINKNNGHRQLLITNENN